MTAFKLKQFAALFLSTFLVTGAVADPVAAPAGSASAAASPSSANAKTPESQTADSNSYVPGGDIYVSDRANVWLRSGPGTHYKITGTKHVGDKLKFVRYSSENNKFIEVQDGEDKYWMQARDLQISPCGHSLTDELQKKIDELTEKLNNYDNELAKELEITKKKLEKVQTERDGLEKSVTEKDATIQEMDKLSRDYADKLETKELDMQMRWWMQGALIAFCGAIIGVLFVFIPRPTRQKKRDRFL